MVFHGIHADPQQVYRNSSEKITFPGIWGDFTNSLKIKKLDFRKALEILKKSMISSEDLSGL